MKLSTEVFGEVAVAHAPEELGEEQAEHLARCLANAERVRVVLDLDGCEAIDSAGLTAFLAAQELLRAAGGDLKLSVSNKVNRKILEITRLDEQLEVFEGVVDAVKSFV